MDFYVGLYCFLADQKKDSGPGRAYLNILYNVCMQIFMKFQELDVCVSGDPSVTVCTPPPVACASEIEKHRTATQVRS